MAAANLETEWNRERRERTHRLRKAEQDISASPIANVEGAKYLEGGWMEFDPQKGEVMAPECVQLELKNENDLASISLISRVCEKYGLRVTVPEYKQTWGKPTVVRLVNNYSRED